MIALTLYLLKVVLVSGILYAYYHLACRNRKFHQWNRWYLLSVVPLSLIIPLIHISFGKTESVGPGAFPFPGQAMSDMYSAWLSPVTIHARSQHVTEWVLAGIYLAVCLLLAIKHLYGYRLLLSQKRKRSIGRLQHNIRLIELKEDAGPYSFLRTIFWNPTIPLDSEEGQQVLQHEMAHIRGRHSLDRLWMELACCVFWFNPFFYLLRNELCLVHEFIADEEAIASQDSPDKYATLILSYTLSAGFMASSPVYINHFFHPPIKRRLSMLIRSSSSHRSLWRKLAIIPVTGGLLLAFSCSQQKQEDLQKELPSVTLSKIQPPSPATDISTIDPADIQSITMLKNNPDSTMIISLKNGKIMVFNQEQVKESMMEKAKRDSITQGRSSKVFTFVQQMPQFSGGDEALMKYLHDHIRYPAVARENGTKGTVVVQFIISPDGSISHVKTVGAAKGGGLEEEAIRVVKGMPKWEPGKQNGQPVTVQFSLPVRFVLQ